MASKIIFAGFFYILFGNGFNEPCLEPLTKGEARELLGRGPLGRCPEARPLSVAVMASNKVNKTLVVNSGVWGKAPTTVLQMPTGQYYVHCKL